jgi:aminopeptidase 2
MAAPRLPTVVQPLHYDLLIRTDLAPSALSFSGLVKITLSVHETTSVVVLHSAPSLSLGQASVISTALEHEEEQRAVYTSYDSPLERVTLHFEKPLKKGEQVVLSIAFSAKLSKSMAGYYYSTVVLDGKPVHYSATMFEVCTLL